VPKLVVFRGDAVEHEIHLKDDTIKIGRDARNDIVLDDSLKGVSRLHAEVRADGGRYFIVDLKSRNGVWINGRRVQEKAELALGVPVTLGAYELVLEDDVPTGEFRDVPSHTQHTAVNEAPLDQSNRPSGSATRVRSRAPVATRQLLLWAGAAAAIVLIAAVTLAVVRRSSGKAPDQIALTEDVRDATNPITDLPSPPPAPKPQPGLTEIGDPRKRAIDERLTAAEKEIGDRDYRVALDHVLPVLAVIAHLGEAGVTDDFEVENQKGLELKQQAEQGLRIARSSGPGPTPGPAPLPPPPDVVETPGIPRRPNESPADYNTRVSGLLVNFQEGNRYLGIPDFANALARFRLVDNAQKGYRGVDTLITDTTARQRKAVEDAISSGQQNEQAEKWSAARLWYQAAVTADPTSTSARERYQSLLNRMIATAEKLFTTGSTARKLGNRQTARNSFQLIVDLMQPSDEIRIRAEKELEGLKK